MPSPRPAVGVHTDLLARARVLQGRWDHLLGEGTLGAEPSPEATAGLRPTIVESWRRTLATQASCPVARVRSWVRRGSRGRLA